jgi:hypothetical protein
MVTTDSIILRARLVAGGPYLGTFNAAALRRLIADNYAITSLPVDLRAKRGFPRDRHTEEPDAQRGGRALPRLCPRGGSIVGR